MKEKKIIGARCPKCKMIICPPYMTRCPVCQNDDYSLVNLETGLEMPQVGYMLGTPPITVFANARFARYAPFGRGRVILGESQSALPIQVFTTTGFLKPGIFKAGTKVKIVFRRVHISRRSCAALSASCEDASPLIPAIECSAGARQR